MVNSPAERAFNSNFHDALCSIFRRCEDEVSRCGGLPQHRIGRDDEPSLMRKVYAIGTSGRTFEPPYLGAHESAQRLDRRFGEVTGLDLVAWRTSRSTLKCDPRVFVFSPLKNVGSASGLPLFQLLLQASETLRIGAEFTVGKRRRL